MLGAGLLCGGVTADAADPRAYSLAHPTPRDNQRELSTDRPDKTESPYTVDAGHYQLEFDLVSYAIDHDEADGADTRSRTLTIAPLNLKIGLTPNVDLQFVAETYLEVRATDRVAGTVERRSGFGDVTVRLKVNRWGNDDGATAFAVMPYVKLPTSRHGLGNDVIEGGVILPLAVELSGGWGLGLMGEVDVRRNAADDGHALAFIHSITFSHDLAGRLGGYVEFFSELSTDHDSDWIGTLDVGLTCRVSDDLQLDAGVNIGLTAAADDWNPFLGLARRF